MLKWYLLHHSTYFRWWEDAHSTFQLRRKTSCQYNYHVWYLARQQICCCWQHVVVKWDWFLKGIFARKKDELIEVHMKPKTLSSIWYSKIGVTWTSGRQFFVLMFLHVMLLEWKLFPVCKCPCSFEKGHSRLTNALFVT